MTENVPFEDLPGVGSCTVEGRNGTVLMGKHPVTGESLAVVLGRRHLYEGGEASMKALIRFLDSTGVGEIVSLSAAGGVHRGIEPGELIVIQEIIDLQNHSRLYPRETKSIRFLPSKRLTRAVEQAANRARRPLVRGTLACNAAIINAAPTPCPETSPRIKASRPGVGWRKS